MAAVAQVRLRSGDGGRGARPRQASGPGAVRHLVPRRLAAAQGEGVGSCPVDGLAETMDESIRYAIRTPHDGADMTPCVLAGPTCDSADVLYEKMPYPLPVTLEIGDKLLIEGTGAYTSTYSAVAFNGIPPLRTYQI